MKFAIALLFAFAAVFSTTGGQPVKDVPIPSNQSIIIFSNTGGGATEGGRVRQNISFRSQTALTLTGGLENDWVRITPSGNSFTAVAKFHKASGSATFTVTATTAGDAEKGFEGMTASFTFRVLVLGVDFPHLTQSFFEFRVGSTVAVTLPVYFAAQQAQLNIAKVPTAIVSQTYGEVQIYTDTEHGNINRTRWAGEPSGISIDPTLDEYNYVRGATLTGTALRPGIYYYAFEISSYDNSGGLDPFPGANGYGIVIINVYDDREALRICVPYTYVPDDNAIRVIRHDRSDYASSRLVGEFTRSGDVWARQVSELIAEGVFDVWQYLMARDEETGTWYLSGRNYLSDETPPEFTLLSSATKTYSGPIPPNTGWTNGVLAIGGNHFSVPGYGFFDKKGERQIEIEGQEPFVGPLYEQQPVVAAQYAGWSNPPATQFADGVYLAPCPDGKWRVSVDPVAIDGTVVKKQKITGMAVPYHPPTAQHPIGGVNYGDLAVLIPDAAGNKIAVNANLPHTPGGMELNIGGISLAVPAHYTFLRQLPPPVSNETARSESISCILSNESVSTTYSRQKNFNALEPDSGLLNTKIIYDDKTTNKSSYTGDVTLNSWTAAGGIVTGVIGATLSPSGSATYNYNRDVSSVTYYVTANYGTDSTTETTVDTAALNSITGSSARAILAPASGRNENDSYVRGYAAAFVDMSASFTTNTTHVYTVNQVMGGVQQPTWTESSTGTGTGGIGLTGAAICPSRVSLSSFAMSGVTRTEVAKNYNGSVSFSFVYGTPEDNYTETSSESVQLSHQHTTYDGTDTPAGLRSEGLTHYVKTTVAVNGTSTTVDEWYNDPDGTVYESHKTSALDVDSYPIPATAIQGTISVSASESNSKKITRIGE